MESINNKLEDLGIELPIIKEHSKGLIMIRQDEKLLYCSGSGPLDSSGIPVVTGKLGRELTLQEGYQAARLCGLNILAHLQNYLGNLERIDKVIKVFGLVASDQEFFNQPKVIHGFSDLMVDIFGENGKHARTAIGTSVLPMNIPVEVEMIVKIK
ncbi:RidA family protein [Ornithinibacillus sp. 4-3]|uniref:RidA family protein n=1 Tax=Ornithinibacillus sp. 4-3 TaxID=3231488 RepID=A0AB39HHG9_9BACI